MENLGIVEFLAHLFSLDMTWLAFLLLNNLHFLFAFFTVMYIFMGGNFKNAIKGTAILTLNLWTIMDFTNLLGLLVFVGNLLMLFYIGKLSLLKIAEETPSVQKNLFFLNEIQGWGTIVLFNLGIFAILGLGGL